MNLIMNSTRPLHVRPSTAVPIPFRPTCAPQPVEPTEAQTETSCRGRVVALVPSSIRDRLEGTILRRHGFETLFLNDELAALEAIVKYPPHLVVIYDSGLANFFLDRLQKAFPTAGFPVVVLSELPDDTYPDMVRACLPLSFRVKDFDRTVSVLLGLPTRKSCRILVRIAVNLSMINQVNASSLATAVDISGGGMLLQCNKPLELGNSYKIQLLGNQYLNFPVLDLRVTRRVESPLGGRQLHRFAGRFENVSLPFMEKLIAEFLP